MVNLVNLLLAHENGIPVHNVARLYATRYVMYLDVHNYGFKVS